MDPVYLLEVEEAVDPVYLLVLGHSWVICILFALRLSFCLVVFVFGFDACLIPEASIGQRRQGEVHCRDGGRR